MTDKKTLTHSTVEALLAEVFELILDGWAISDDNRGTAALFGGAYSVEMVRTDSTVNALKVRVEAVQARPKMTPQERMAHARSQRGKGKIDLAEVVKA